MKEYTNTPELDDFLISYPESIQNIAAHKVPGWEWSLAAAIFRHLNKAEFKKLRNIRSGHYFKSLPQVSRDTFLDWIMERTHVMANIVPPLVHLFDRLTASFGNPGEDGDAEEINDVCCLLHDMLAQMINHEEILRFSGIPNEGEELRSILIDAIGSNAEKLRELPDKLDEAVALATQPPEWEGYPQRKIEWQVVFDLPDGFDRRFEEAVQRYAENLLL